MRSDTLGRQVSLLVSSQCVCRSPDLKMAQIIAANIVACQRTGLLPRQQACPCKLRAHQSPYSWSRCDHVLAKNQQHSLSGSVVPSRSVPVLSGQSGKRRITCSVSAQQRQVCSAQLQLWFAAEACILLCPCRILCSRLGQRRSRQQSCLVMRY